MSDYEEGDWLRYRHRGYFVTRTVVDTTPGGRLIMGEHKHDQDTHTIDPEYKDSIRKVEDK